VEERENVGGRTGSVVSLEIDLTELVQELPRVVRDGLLVFLLDVFDPLVVIWEFVLEGHLPQGNGKIELNDLRSGA